jgi:uncharacterized RDD family membrane protein YckC
MAGKSESGRCFYVSVVGSLVYVITLGIGVIISAIMVAAREDKRSIHDFIAGTYVTTEKPV